MSQNIPYKFIYWVNEWIHAKQETEQPVSYDSDYDESSSSDDYSDNTENNAILRNPKRKLKTRIIKTRPIIWQERVCWKHLSENPNAIGLLEKNPSYTDIWGLCKNPNAVHLVEKHIKRSIQNGKKIKIHKDYIACGEIDHFSLSQNLDAVWLLEKYPKIINWDYLCFNENAIPLLEKKIEKGSSKINWPHLCTNLKAMHILEQNSDKIDWEKLSFNANAIDMLEQNQDKIDWDTLCFNVCAIQLLEHNQAKINWSNLSWNPEAIELLEQNQNKIDWTRFVENSNPEMCNILENNLDTLDNKCWTTLSKNPIAISILERNQDKIDWKTIFSNPAIFVYDYATMCMSNRQLKKELITVALHPKRIARWIELGMDVEDL